VERRVQSQPRTSWQAALLAPLALAAVVMITACGGSSPTQHPQRHEAATKTDRQSTTATSGAGSTSTQTHTGAGTQPKTTTVAGVTSSQFGPIRAGFKAANHTPTAGKPWSYSVTARDPHGHPLSGSVSIEFMFGSRVVGHDTPRSHPLTSGRFSGTLTFPARSLGIPLNVGAVIHTHMGTVMLTWPVKVQRGH
jgi:predicted small lipoprotein YifL